jgi:hypothetical protein
VKAGERVEDSLLVLYEDSNPVVFNPKPDYALAFFSPNLHLGFSVWRREFDCVGQQVDNDLDQKGMVTHNFRQRSRDDNSGVLLGQVSLK